MNSISSSKAVNQRQHSIVLSAKEIMLAIAVLRAWLRTTGNRGDDKLEISALRSKLDQQFMQLRVLRSELVDSTSERSATSTSTGTSTGTGLTLAERI